MVANIVDICVVLLVLGMAYALMSEGLWGAALQFFNSLFAALIALNFYEPIAAAIAKSVSFLSGMADALCILALFSVSLLALRLATENLAPSMIRFPKPIYHIGAIFFAVAGSAVTMGVLLIALNASPVQKKIFGFYDHKYKPMYGYRLDTEILAIFQHTTGNVFSRSGGRRDPYREYGDARIFDPKGDWLMRSQTARPHGSGDILDEGSSEGAAEGGGEAQGGDAAGGGGAAGKGATGPGIPGGTAGAAAGLAPTQ